MELTHRKRKRNDDLCRLTIHNKSVHKSPVFDDDQKMFGITHYSS